MARDRTLLVPPPVASGPPHYPSGHASGQVCVQTGVRDRRHSVHPQNTPCRGRGGVEGRGRGYGVEALDNNGTLCYGPLRHSSHPRPLQCQAHTSPTPAHAPHAACSASRCHPLPPVTPAAVRSAVRGRDDLNE
ncbi:hypothetical protein E2C01_052630 [Portunus trituberculatus]|uniref:Uncharacterized protein n=1 Tax=Portunus trituberculatus TaxID=210409 RepID=A0A5B7GMA9_PORTR|nr:hypothetical protein [Portunus trituberculatus]